ncbi:MAG: hypothetical protein IKN41_00490 [Candidatus Methanomethylophilaceae archaeon]|nr:hypothetical protein [Candidatus Methanomethylophilaceae archaeon]
MYTVINSYCGINDNLYRYRINTGGSRRGITDDGIFKERCKRGEIWRILLNFYQNNYPDNKNLEKVLEYKLDFWFLNNVKELFTVEESGIKGAYDIFIDNWKKPLENTILTKRLSVLLRRIKVLNIIYLAIICGQSSIKNKTSVEREKYNKLINTVDKFKELVKKKILWYLMH